MSEHPCVDCGGSGGAWVNELGRVRTCTACHGTGHIEQAAPPAASRVTLGEAAAIALAEIERSEQRFAEATARDAASPEGEHRSFGPHEGGGFNDLADELSCEIELLKEKLRALEASLIAAEAVRDSHIIRLEIQTEKLRALEAERDAAAKDAGDFAEQSVVDQRKREIAVAQLTSATAERDEWESAAASANRRWARELDARNEWVARANQLGDDIMAAAEVGQRYLLDAAEATARAEKAEAERDEWKRLYAGADARAEKLDADLDATIEEAAGYLTRLNAATADNADLTRTIAQNQGVYREKVEELRGRLSEEKRLHKHNVEQVGLAHQFEREQREKLRAKLDAVRRLPAKWRDSPVEMPWVFACCAAELESALATEPSMEGE